MMSIKMTLYTYAEAILKLSSIGEEHLLQHWNALTESEQTLLLNEIQALVVAKFKRQQRALQQHLKVQEQRIAKSWEPFCDYYYVGSQERQELGTQLLAQGKVGCLLVAGGQGTRLSYDAPKGTYPVSVIKKKSLFQIFAEKTLAASRQANCRLPLAIMTSPLNHAATLGYFKENNNFGLDEKQLCFFMQGELPFLDPRGHLLIQDRCSIAKGPDGNGGSLNHFVQSGIWDTWRDQGIEYINYVLIDNPLADPFDAELVGFHATEGCEITVKCVDRNSPEERVGLLVQGDSRVSIVEYFEISESERKAVLPDGSFKHRCANISLFCFSMDFTKKSVKNISLPWHLTSKPICLNGPVAWKFETFIFDYLAAANVVKALLYPREQTFAPLKGTDSLETVQERLNKYDIATLEKRCGHRIPFCPLELEQQFHYPTPELLEKWKGCMGPFGGYIQY